jgi:hypothetical protein
MRKALIKAGLLLGVLVFAASTVTAQQIVHALTGTVTSINPKTQTIRVNTDDGSEGLFKFLTDKKASIEFDKNVKAETTPPSSFSKLNTRVLVFYIGDDAERTAVALEDLGAGPFVNTVGTLLRLDKHAHMVTIQDDKNSRQSFHIDVHTIGEASQGVIQGEKFEADKGAKVRVIGTSANGAQTALFIRALTF